MNLNKLIQAKEKEFMDRYEGANTIQSSISSFMAKDIFKFVAQSIQSGYELAIKEMALIVNHMAVHTTDAASNAIEETKQKLQSLLKGKL